MIKKTEKEWEKWLADRLRKREFISEITVNSKNASSTSSDMSIGILCGKHSYDVFEDSSNWNHDLSSGLYKGKILRNISGGLTPDIVLRSNLSNENRIYVEIKESAKLHYGIFDSQIVRYFIHLLATSTDTPTDGDLRRAVLLAAPDYWFDDNVKSRAWYDFCDRYVGLAEAFHITIGEIRLNENLLMANPGRNAT